MAFVTARFEKIHPKLGHKHTGGPGSILPGQGYSLQTDPGFAGGFAAPGNSERSASSGFDVFGVAAPAFYARPFHPGDQCAVALFRQLRPAPAFLCG